MGRPDPSAGCCRRLQPAALAPPARATPVNLESCRVFNRNDPPRCRCSSAAVVPGMPDRRAYSKTTLAQPAVLFPVSPSSLRCWMPCRGRLRVPTPPQSGATLQLAKIAVVRVQARSMSSRISSIALPGRSPNMSASARCLHDGLSLIPARGTLLVSADHAASTEAHQQTFCGRRLDRDAAIRFRRRRGETITLRSEEFRA